MSMRFMVKRIFICYLFLISGYLWAHSPQTSTGPTLTSLEKRALNNLKASQKFLEQNKVKPHIQVLPSGLQYEVQREGKGAPPSLSDFVVVHYIGRLIDGTEFDNTYIHYTPMTMAVNAMIPGWIEALQLMKPGAKWTLYIPPELGYGEEGAGQLIEPNMALIFDVELLSIKPSLDSDGDGLPDED